MRACRVAHTSLRYGDACTKRSFSVAQSWRSRRSTVDLLKHGADVEKVSVTGWVRSVRKQKRVAFAAISDGSTVDSLQAVLKPEDAARLSTGSAVEVQGDWKASTGAKQSHELQVSHLRILGENDAESNPLQPKYQTPEYLRTISHLRARIPANALLLHLRSNLIAAITTFFNREGFVQTHTPVITSSDCEGAGEVFTVSSKPPASSLSHSVSTRDTNVEHFFRNPKYLTVSAQLHLEALAQAVSRVWTLSPTFRAEQSDTPRHLSEFYMLEAEICFVQDLNEVMDLVETLLRSAVSDLKASRVGEELLRTKQSAQHEAHADAEKAVTADALQHRWDGIIAKDWPRITYKHAIEILRFAHTTNKAHFEFPPTFSEGLQAEHERYIATTLGQGRPVFVIDYPRGQKPFYMPSSTTTSTLTSNDGTADTVACFDLLVPDLCELAGGSLREHRSRELLDAMRDKGVAGENLEWYQDLRKYGSVPHGGFGLGFDRLICYLAGVNNVRDVVAFPRWHGRCDC